MVAIQKNIPIIPLPIGPDERMVPPRAPFQELREAQRWTKQNPRTWAIGYGLFVMHMASTLSRIITLYNDPEYAGLRISEYNLKHITYTASLFGLTQGVMGQFGSPDYSAMHFMAIYISSSVAGYLTTSNLDPVSKVAGIFLASGIGAAMGATRALILDFVLHSSNSLFTRQFRRLLPPKLNGLAVALATLVTLSATYSITKNLLSMMDLPPNEDEFNYKNFF